MTEEPEIAVHVAGVILATLQYDMLNSHVQGDVEGLLFGHVRRKTQQHITDDAPDRRRDHVDLVVGSYLVIPPHRRYYDRRGNVDRGILETIVGREKAEVGSLPLQFPCSEVRALTFRAEITRQLRPSIRDAAIYDSLPLVLGPPRTFGADEALRDFHVLAIFTASTNPGASILNLDFAFFRRGQDGGFKKIPVKISNLVESSQVRHEAFLPTMPPHQSFPNNPLAKALNAMSLGYVDQLEQIFTHTLQLLK
ncbi:hypothetical protein HK104_008400, partial [Borealophlyctis nickersoniae]